MSLSSALMALLLLPPVFGHGAEDHATRRVGAWTVQARTDRFTHHATCQLRESKVRYARQALVFQLPGKLDTSDAVYRIDDGPVMSVRNDAMELARLGFALHNDDLSNPSGGLVTVPAHRLAGARTVRIEAGNHGAVYRYRIDGIDQALEAGRALGCGPDDFVQAP